jgi:hypothetical protein
LDHQPDNPPDEPSDTNGVAVAIEALREAHRAEIAAKDEVIATKAEIITALKAERDAEREGRLKADAVLAGERQRADNLRDRLNTMQEQLSDAHAALQASASADARADRAEAERTEERGRADRAEAAVTAERARVDALRERIEAFQTQLRARQEVIDAAEATRKAARISGGRGAAGAVSGPRGEASKERRPKLADPYRWRNKVRLPASDLQLVAAKRARQVARNFACGKEPIIPGQTRRWMAVLYRPKRAGADGTNDQDYHQPHKGGPFFQSNWGTPGNFELLAWTFGSELCTLN